jgi:hypothetical protein
MNGTIDGTEEMLGGLKQGEGYWDMVRRVVATAARAEKAEAELAAERARLDWLGSNGYLLDEMTHGAGKPHPADYWLCTNGERSGAGPTPRAALDAAMKEGAK